jgi:hypothetical protein
MPSESVGPMVDRRALRLIRELGFAAGLLTTLPYANHAPERLIHPLDVLFHLAVAVDYPPRGTMHQVVKLLHDLLNGTIGVISASGLSLKTIR